VISFLIESALRPLIVAMAVWIGLRIFRVGNVLTQKAVWGLVLAVAVFMPVLLPVATRLPGLPVRAIVVLPSDPDTLLGEIRSQMRPAPAQEPSEAVPEAILHATPPTAAANPDTEATDANSSSTPSQVKAPFVAANTVVDSEAAPRSSYTRLRALSSGVPWTRLAILLYSVVCAMLVLRLVFGVVAAIRLWRSATPAQLDVLAPFSGGLHLRSSPAVSSPVTIGSSVILPADYESWDSEKLRIVLAHERSHVRQGDFYLQLFTGLYTAIFWFSPLGWWLKRKLSDLAEAISDHAGLQEAASRSSYAQVLLEFAASPRPTLIGVAMARTGSISRRIERLLNDSIFRQAFAGTRLRALVAVLLVPVALVGATALIHVQAAGQAAQQPAPPAEPEEAPTAGISTPDRPSDPPEPSEIQEAPATPAAPKAPGQIAPVQSLPPIKAVSAVKPPAEPGMPTTMARTIESYSSDKDGQSSSYRYSVSSNGDSFAIIHGDKGQMAFAGDIKTAEIDKARKLAHGDFLWFKRDGKSYFIDDPATVKQAEELYKPMELLGKRQEVLGKQQEVLGKQQEELGEQQQKTSVPTPDVSKEIAAINAAVAELQSKAGKTVTQSELSDLQSKLGDLQGRLGSLQGEMGAVQGEFGSKMGKLGEKQGELGAQQGKLGQEQARLAAQADQKVKVMIDRSMQNGTAHPVD
jgi:beta-lactamase regulating signal transducer with metallopeptidase domain